MPDKGNGLTCLHNRRYWNLWCNGCDTRRKINKWTFGRERTVTCFSFPLPSSVRLVAQCQGITSLHIILFCAYLSKCKCDSFLLGSFAEQQTKLTFSALDAWASKHWHVACTTSSVTNENGSLKTKWDNSHFIVSVPSIWRSSTCTIAKPKRMNNVVL